MQKKLANNISLNYEIYESNTIQQETNCECGIHVLVNAQLILKSIEKSYSSNLEDVIWAGHQLTNELNNTLSSQCVS